MNITVLEKDRAAVTLKKTVNYSVTQHTHDGGADKAAESQNLSVDILKYELETLASDFRTIPDHEKNFEVLQERLEYLLSMTSKLDLDTREPLLPILKTFQSFLNEHLKNLQAEAQSLNPDFTQNLPPTRAIRAYGAASRPPQKSTPSTSQRG